MEDVFVVDLARGPLGVDVETGRSAAGWDGKSLLIKKVKEGALLDWCRQHRRQVRPGARILAVNGVRESAEALLAECQRPQRLRLELRCTGGRRCGAEAAEELSGTVRRCGSAAAAVQLLRRQRGRWHPAWGAEALLQVALRSTGRTRLAWAKDPVVLELAEWQLAEAQLVQDLPALEVTLTAMDAARRLGLPIALKDLSLVAEKALPQAAQLSTKAMCRLLWLASPHSRLAPVASLLHTLRRRKDFDGLDLRMIFQAARRWSESTWLQEPQQLLPGRLVAQGQMAEECVISFSVKLMEMPLEGWSLLFACKEERLPSLYVSKSGVLAASKAKSKSGLKEDLQLQLQLSEPSLKPKELSLVTLRLQNNAWSLSVDGARSQELAATGSAGGVELVCKDAFGTQVADALVGHLVHRPVRSCPGKDVPLLQKLLQRLAVPDLEAIELFPCDLVPAAELVGLAEDVAQLELLTDADALRALGREILRRRPELKEEELQVARGAFAMLGLKLQEAWSEVGVKVSKRGGHMVTSQAFTPRNEARKRPRNGNKDLEDVSPPPSPPRR